MRNEKWEMRNDEWRMKNEEWRILFLEGCLNHISLEQDVAQTLSK